MEQSGCFTCQPPGVWPVLELQLLCDILAASGGSCDLDMLVAQASCFSCLTPGEWDLIALQIACNISDGTASCDVPTLLSNASCIACLTPGYWPILDLQLWCNILDANSLPTGALAYDNFDTYGAGAALDGLFGGVNGRNPTMNWGRYVVRLTPFDLLVYDNNDGYGNGVGMGGLDGGVEVVGTWDSSYAAR